MLALGLLALGLLALGLLALGLLALGLLALGLLVLGLLVLVRLGRIGGGFRWCAAVWFLAGGGWLGLVFRRVFGAALVCFDLISEFTSSFGDALLVVSQILDVRVAFGLALQSPLESNEFFDVFDVLANTVTLSLQPVISILAEQQVQ